MKKVFVDNLHWEERCRLYNLKEKNRETSFNSKKYCRSPRAKHWIVCRENEDGTIECYSNQGWNQDYALMWIDSQNPESYAESYRKSGIKAFVVRVGSKNCPVEIDYSKRTHIKPESGMVKINKML